MTEYNSASGEMAEQTTEQTLTIYCGSAEAIIKDSVEPSLEEYRPPGITSLKFSKLSLGTMAPKIEGTRVQSLKEGEITMEIDLRWGGDPNIVLAVQAAHVASIPFQLKDLQVFTIVRAIFQLSDEIPCISAVVVALLAEPKRQIDYTLKAVGGSLTAIPGLSDMIDGYRYFDCNNYAAVAPLDRRTHWWRTCRYKVTPFYRVFGKDMNLDGITYVLGGFNQIILYSLSPGSGATPAMARAVSGLATMYRITGDHWDKWVDVFSHFNVTRDLSSANMIGGKGLRGKSWPDWSYKDKNEPRVLQGGYRVTVTRA
ncbi:hypothetical protein CASFOL_014415 [Castilleja foliolosa]|uniref:SMP-LTD domain-containing protein n=1 Tax=Castilleja foliolosa TaxID=1961234 RepID=A0ABD3DRY7_9LAMI